VLAGSPTEPVVVLDNVLIHPSKLVHAFFRQRTDAQLLATPAP
jgi:hypothetical protein